MPRTSGRERRLPWRLGNAQTVEVSMRLSNTVQTSRPWRIHGSPRTSGSRMCGHCRLRAVRTTSSARASDRLQRPVARLSPLGARALGDTVEGRRAARVGQRGRWLRGADAPRAVAGGSARRSLRPRLRRPSLHLALSARRRVGGGDRESDYARRDPRRLGSGRDGRLPWRAGRLRKPNGLLGTGYMAAIRPFRHLIVYPQMLRQIARAWRAGVG